LNRWRGYRIFHNYQIVFDPAQIVDREGKIREGRESISANAHAGIQLPQRRLNCAQFALKTLKNASKCAVFELFFNLLVRPEPDISAKSLRSNDHILEERAFYPHSAAP
jgi:hypothetical protein